MKDTFDVHKWNKARHIEQAKIDNIGNDINELQSWGGNNQENKELLLELVDSLKSELENVDDSEWDVETSKAWCDDATMELQDLKDHFTSEQSREDI